MNKKMKRQKGIIHFILIGIFIIFLISITTNRNALDIFTGKNDKSWVITTKYCITTTDTQTSPECGQRKCSFVNNEIAKNFQQQFRTEVDCNVALAKKEEPIIPMAYTIRSKTAPCQIPPCPIIQYCILIPIKDMSPIDNRFGSFDECNRYSCVTYGVGC